MNCLSIQIFHLFILFNIQKERAMERDNFMSPTEALEFGLIDKILTHPDTLENSEEKK